MTNPILKRPNHSNSLDSRHPKHSKIIPFFQFEIISTRILSETQICSPKIALSPTILQNTKFLFLLNILRNEQNNLSETIESILIDQEEKIENDFLKEQFILLISKIWQIASTNFRTNRDANLSFSRCLIKISKLLDEESEKTKTLKQILIKTNDLINKYTPFISFYDDFDINIHSEILKNFPTDSPKNIAESFKHLLTIYPRRPQLLGAWIDNNEISLKDLPISLDRFKVLIPYLNHFDLRGYQLKVSNQLIKHLPNPKNLFVDCSQINLELIFRLTRLCKLQLENIDPEYQNNLAGISVLTNLTQLDLSGCEEMAEEGDNHLSSLIQLKELSLSTHQMKNLNFIRCLTNLESLDLSECDKLKDQHLSALGPLKNLRILNIKECAKLTFDLFIYLKEFTRLKKLIFSSLNDAEEGNNENFHFITHLVNLNHLEISNCEISDENAASFGQLRQLNYFFISESDAITDKFFNCITHLTNLTELKIERCDGITAEGFVYSSQLRNLKVVHLNDCGITGAGILALSAFKQLSSLSLFAARQIKDEHLKSLARLVYLEFLNLNFCKQISDQGILFLCALPRLERLQVEHNEKITDEGMKAFQDKVSNKKMRIIH